MVAFGSARIANLPSTTISTSNEQKLPASKMIVSSAGAGGPCCAPACAGAHTAARPSAASAIGNRRAVLMTVVTNMSVTPSAGWRTHPIADAPTASKPYPEYMPPDDADHPSAGSSVVPSLTKPRGSKFRSASAVLRPASITRAPADVTSVRQKRPSKPITQHTVFDGVPSRGVGDHVRSPGAVGQFRGAAGNASSALSSVSSARLAAAM